MKKKILIVFGTRPEGIKMSPLVQEFKNFPDKFETKVCVTAQHREMLDQVLEIFEIKPDFDLNIMKKNQDLYDVTSKVILKMRKILREFAPDLVMVHGDTTTTFSTSLASYYQRIDVAHVEAGLRTNKIYSPFPEEINRKLTGSIAKYHFAPTEISKENLLKENVKSENIFITGNTVIDALYLALKKINKNSKLEKNILRFFDENLKNFSFDKDKFILVTGHRRENFGEGFINLCEAIKEIALKYKNFHIIYPVHLNPKVQKPVYEILSGLKNVHLINPLEYLQFIYLMNKSYLLLTDSGGVQEEAPSLGKPVLLMRDSTERPEALKAGTVKLLGTNKNKIIFEVSKLIDDKEHYEKMAKSHNPYGDGNACKKIVEIISMRNFFNEE